VTTPARVDQPPAEVAAPEREQLLPRSFVRDASGGVAKDPSPRDLVAALARPESIVWVDIDSTSRHQRALLDKVFDFHPLSVEDTLNPNSRVKIEAYDGYLFLNVRVVRFCDDTADPYDLETVNLYLFIGPNYLVTVHAEPSASVDIVHDLVSRNPDVMARGASRLAHMVVDTAIDAYFPILDRIDEFIDGLEDRVFQHFDNAALHDIFAVKRMVLTMRRYLAPQREIFNVLTNRPSPLLTSESQLYFRDVYDHMLRINDTLENYRELLSSTLDSYLTQVNNRLGAITKGLSVVATLSVPFVVVSGMWGMNFGSIPLSRNPNGFWIMLVLQLVIGFGLLGVLRWRRLI
jgi:magnesium transporter